MKAVVDPHRDLLERTLRAARRVEVPGVEEDEARERALRAVARARALDRRRRQWLVASSALAVAAAFALVTWTVWPGSPHAPVAGAASPLASETSLVRLPSGDRIQAEPGAHYDVESTELDRRVRLNRGVARFDVASVAGGSFVVDAGDVSVRVRGTVFSVRHDESVVVEVFEGSVEVRRRSARVVLGPGDRWTSEEPEPTRSVEAAGLSEPTATLRPTETSETSVARTVRASAPSDATEPVRLWGSKRAPSAERGLEELSLADARRRLLERDFEGALAACDGHDDAGWQVLRADALRGLRRWREAAEAYDAAIPLLVEARRAQAGYAAARLWSEQVGDASAALASLRESHAATVGSPLEERARVLEIELLRRLGRDDGAQVREYLRRYPTAGGSDADAVEPRGRP